MTGTAPVKSYRIQSIDVLRGLVMVIMALDHVRDFFYKIPVTAGNVDAATLDPTNPATTTPILFFTRWITHFCAPTFVFLAGTSVFLMTQRKSKWEVSRFLISRGIWLVFVEVAIITFGWSFNPHYNYLFLQVIWAIGISMIILGIIVQLPFKVVFAIGLLIVVGHNILDFPSVNEGLKGGLWADLLYFANFSGYHLFGNHYIIIIYSFVPWAGVMMLGYCFGKLFKQDVDMQRRRKILIRMGAGLIIFFIVLRATNLYGDPVPWSVQGRGPFYTFLSFLNVNKYPPSLLYLCITLGPGMLFLVFIEKVKNKITDILNIYGRVPMFYYVLHFYIMHTLIVIMFYLTGHTNDQITAPGQLFYFKPDDMGFGLGGVYLVWIFVVVVLYPLCKKYNLYKSTHKKWWLSYI